ncbi:MaoC family dehydratase [Janibacter sp. YIM B02568]|uniref:MaoC family dehydratase n=1 Tax=Janibacter endophyticus TaxID=2806261 RepID=UPI00194EC7D9|nr:MaoC family dehydratase [Janibacter endophyticus]MBM6545421.1 MaoC family dehydratase [Janibacter endophyticus]
MTILTSGAQMPEREFGPITQTDIVRFAGAGGDFNPLHHDPAAAASAGFETPIAHGQFSAAVLSGAVADWVGITRLSYFEARFRAPVPIGTTLSLTAEVTEVTDGVATLSVAATRDDGAVAVSGTARASAG